MVRMICIFLLFTEIIFSIHGYFYLDLLIVYKN